MYIPTYTSTYGGFGAKTHRPAWFHSCMRDEVLLGDVTFCPVPCPQVHTYPEKPAKICMCLPLLRYVVKVIEVNFHNNRGRYGSRCWRLGVVWFIDLKSNQVLCLIKRLFEQMK